MLSVKIAPRLVIRLWAVCVLLAPAAGAAAAPPSLPAATSAFLAKFVDSDGNVNYAAIKRNPLELKGLLRRVETFDAAAAKGPDREAFYLNAYNLLVIGEVVARYPLESVQKVPGFFDKNLVSVAGEKLTLNDLEAQKLRQPYADPRVHFALVCGAKGCPRLSRAAYVGNQLDAQLTIQARKVLQDPVFVRVEAGARKVQLSQIFKWYEADFKASGKTGLPYVNQFRDAKQIPATYAVDYYAYDWALNSQK
ncbi:DUF547 domain-containing protein [Hymenobacter sp.]|uniref:DUF547 domain-containing protein n=1 Tax=Hymenobacter sp. TaxID=1898978 RepID=UPI00286C0E00|nr:DUF547 domain-containing protein [Hymenobacter sp.]